MLEHVAFILNYIALYHGSSRDHLLLHEIFGAFIAGISYYLNPLLIFVRKSADLEKRGVFEFIL